MGHEPLDDLDKAILHLLQVDARNNTNAAIGERVDVAASTVGNRIRELERRDIINGYHPDIDYRRANLPLHTLFVCTAPVAERRSIAEETLDLYGVIDVRVTIAGACNVHVETVSQNVDELEDVIEELDRVGLEVNSSEILQSHRARPFDNFGAEQLQED